MTNFIKKILIFILLGYLIGEVVVRVFNASIDVPDFYQDKDGLLKNKPNQSGYAINGNKWMITKYGQFGYEPKSLDNLITVIGDSFIENKTSPPDCHQAYFLSNMASNYNFYPCARAGASFIEFMEMTKSLNYLKPKMQLLYVHHGDFIESISEIKKKPLTVQLSIKTNKIIYAKYSRSRFKTILYNFKFAYYIYIKYLLKGKDTSTNNRNEKNLAIDFEKVQSLLNFVKSNYNTDNIILVFSPDTDQNLIKLVKHNHFQTFELKTDNYKSWQLENDSHWSCFGHEEAAKQVSKYINQSSFK